VDEHHHIVSNVEASLAKRTHREADLIRVRADLVEQEYRQRMVEAARAQDPTQRARLRILAEQVRAGASRLREIEEATRQLATNTIREAPSIPTGTDPATLEPVTYVPVTKADLKRQKEEAATIAWQRLRDDRDELLRASDWTQAADSPISDKQRTEWAKYREKLRDLPAKTPDPAKTRWPQPPS
jgi:hypothetical protein